MAKWKFKKIAAWTAVAFLIVMACLAGCNRNGSLLPMSEWFVPAPSGELAGTSETGVPTPYDEATEPIRDIAGLFGPVGDAIALGIGGFGLLGTAVFGVKSKFKGVKVRRIGPAIYKLVYNLWQIKENQPEVWAQMRDGIQAGMNADDRAVINHFRPDKDTKLKVLKGVAS